MGADALAEKPHNYALNFTSDGKWTPDQDPPKGTVTMSATDNHPSEPHEPIQAFSGPLPVEVSPGPSRHVAPQQDMAAVSGYGGR